MKLESKFDFKALRKAQMEVTRKFNRAAKAIEKLELGEDINRQIEELLTRKFDEEMKASAANLQTGTPADQPAETAGAESFV